jgi:hypothetical protein
MSVQSGARTSGPAAGAATAVDRSDLWRLVGRILLGGIFVVSGYGKLMGLAAFAASLEKNGVPYASGSSAGSRSCSASRCARRRC